MSEEVSSLFTLLKQGIEYKDVENVSGAIRELHQVVMIATREQIIAVVTTDMLNLITQAAK